MDLTTDDEYDAVGQLAREIGLEVLAPVARQAERNAEVPGKAWATLLETGLTSPVSEKFGGSGVPGSLSRMVAVRNLAFGDAGIAMAAVWSGAVAGLIGEHGTDEQRLALPILAADPSARCAVALYEGYGRVSTSSQRPSPCMVTPSASGVRSVRCPSPLSPIRSWSSVATPIRPCCAPSCSRAPMQVWP